MHVITDTISTEPTLKGALTKAWFIEPSIEDLAVHSMAVSQWLIEAPWAHPAWHSYYLGVIHLRFEDAVIHRPDATHELVLLALDPGAERQVFLDASRKHASNTFLMPPNFAAQFIELDDDLARERAQRTVQDIVDEKLNPDTDARQDWVRLFGSNMLVDRS